MMIEFFLSNINFLEDCSVLGSSFNELLQEIFFAIKLAVPALVVALCAVDMVRAVISQDDKAMKKAQSDSIKRIFIGVAVFFVPTIINILLRFAGNVTGVCGVG